MNGRVVHDLLAADQWAVAHGVADVGPYILRYREPVLQSNEVEGYPHCLRILWPYADEASGALPDPGVSSALEEFEARVCPVLEHDAHAVLGTTSP